MGILDKRRPRPTSMAIDFKGNVNSLPASLGVLKERTDIIMDRVHIIIDDLIKDSSVSVDHHAAMAIKLISLEVNTPAELAWAAFYMGVLAHATSDDESDPSLTIN